jgi:hypothetical protein
MSQEQGPRWLIAYSEAEVAEERSPVGWAS